MTKKWDKPELTVLVRGNAEEAVLAGCKNANSNGPDGVSCRVGTPCLAPNGS